MDREPADGSDDHHFDQELHGKGACVEIVAEEKDGTKVDSDGDDPC